MKRKAGTIFAVLLVFAAFMVFVSEAPAPTVFEITKFCTSASAPGDPITFSATITNESTWQGLVIDGCSDDQPGSVINESFPITINPGSPNTATITGYYYPAAPGSSTDRITCSGHGTVGGSATVQSNEATCTSPPPPPPSGCTRTPGYWKNHPDAWPVASITIGGVLYTKAEAIEWLKTPVDGDKTITMFKALVAAKLNGLSGASLSCLGTAIGDADAWMAAHGPVGSYVPASSAAWKSGEPLYGMLDAYNNGYLPCAPHCD